MQGTAMSEEGEFRETYGMDVVQVPTHMPCIRVDNTAYLYSSRGRKLDQICNLARYAHEEGRPLLIGTGSVEESEEVEADLK